MKKLFLILLLIIPLNVNAYSSSATSTVLMDMDSNNVLYYKNMNEVRSVASISKIMTAIVAIESEKTDDIVTIGDEISKAYGSGVYIQIGEEIKLEDLLYGLMLRSGNDASLSIAKYVGGSVEEFVNMMNKKAKQIGMKNSVFNNPNGLDDKGGNQSTAYDMALLTSYAMGNDLYKKIVSTKKHTVKTNKNYYSWTNKHKLLGAHDYVTGGKTGFTEIARRTLVTTANKDNVNLVVVTLNDGNDFSDHINLFEEAFNSYSNYKILNKGEIEIIGEKYYPDSMFYIENNFNYTMKNENNNVVLNFKLEKNKKYVNGDSIGIVEVIVNDNKVHEEKIYISKKEKVSFWQKILKWVSNLW